MSHDRSKPVEPVDLALARAQRRERVRAVLAHERDPPSPPRGDAREHLLARSEAWSRRVRVLLGSPPRTDAAS